MGTGEGIPHTGAVELRPEDVDGKIEGLGNGALGVPRTEVGSKGVCKWNVLKHLLMVRLFSRANSLRFCFFLFLFS